MLIWVIYHLSPMPTPRPDKHSKKAGKSASLKEILKDLRATGAPECVVEIDHQTAMKPEVFDRPFDKKGWIFELKYDGFRMLAASAQEGVRLLYKSGKDANRYFPELARAVAELPFSAVVLDGEVVMLDAAGRPSFQALQRRARHIPGHGAPVAAGTAASVAASTAASTAATLFIFDLLALESFDLRPLPLTTRKAFLRRILPEEGPLRYIEDVPERGEDLYRAVADLGLEGIVAKRADSPYRGGYTRDWLKVRVDLVGDFVVIGFVPAGRTGFHKLYVAAYDPKAKGFVYAGSVGTGFSRAETEEVRARVEAARRPTSVLVGPRPSRKGLIWVEPEVVCEVRYKEWTMDGLLRLPVFLRLRDDKAPEECLRQEEISELGDEEAGPGEEPEEPEPEEPQTAGSAASASPASPEALRFTRLDKVFWPAEGYTKGDLVEYYRAISPWILPYLRDRPLVVDRYPDGITGKSFFQKSAPAATAGRAGRIRTVPIRSEGSGRGIDYFLVDSEPALLELANLGAIPLHVWSSRASDLDHPDWCILDLDPKQAPFQHVVRIAQEIRALCEEIGLDSFPKTSGGSGLHVLLPLAGQLDHDQARQLGELLARVLVDRLPEIATTARAISARRGRVYVDALQNGRGKLLVAPFSVRPRPGATVSTPLSWPEVDGRLDVRRHTIRTVPRRFRKREDPLLPVLETRPDLSAILERLLEQV